MRIDANIKVGALAGRVGSARSASAQPFIVNDGAHASASAATTSVASLTSLDTLLALQGAQVVDDPRERRRRLVRRGRSVLDVLESMRGDLLVGRLGTDRLTQLMSIVGQAREEADPEIDALLDDIELRARVELAKHGLFPG